MSTYIKRLLDIAFIAAACACAACSEDVFGGQDCAEGRSVTANIPYRTLSPRVVSVTRATSAENALNNLQVFIFGEDGGLKGYKYVSGTDGLRQDGAAGSVAIKTSTGKCRVYAVANVPTSIYTTLPYGDCPAIPASESEAWDESEVQAGGKSGFTLESFRKCSFLRSAGEFHITENNFLMSGAMNGGGLCDIAANGTVRPLTSGGGSGAAEGADIIKLNRVVSKLKFIVKEGTGVTFTPTGYEIRNIPRQGALVKNDGGAASVEPAGFETLAGGFDLSDMTKETVGGDEVRAYMFENICLPENIQNHNKQSEPASWPDREKDNGYMNAGKAFTVAPPNGTYLVLKGNYSGPYTDDGAAGTADATATYFIHLGDFSSGGAGGWGDFNVERNCSYVYTLTVHGVNSISAEVTKETAEQTNGSAEGLVLNLKGGAVFTVDSHYGQLDMTFDKSSIAAESGSGSSGGRLFMYFTAKDINGTTGVCRLAKDPGGGYSLETENGGTWSGTALGGSYNAGAWEPKNAAWVKFMDGSDQDYPGESSPELKGLVGVLKELIDNKGNDSFWTSGKKTYTCFIDENFYSDRLWSEFVNTDPRYVCICNELHSSADNRSIKGDVIYGIQQKSIQTAYSLSEAATVNAYGCETDHDDNYGNRSSNAGGRLPLYWGSKSTVPSSDPWNGRSNQLQQLDNKSPSAFGSSGREWAQLAKDTGAAGKIQRYRWAQFSCMSRNRDLDGDGIIDDDEVRWYAPTMQQYLGLFIGERAVSPDAHLFRGRPAELLASWSWTRRQAPALHYWSSANETQFVYWSEEGIATSDRRVGQGGGDSAPWAVRCVRNLPKGTGSTNVDAPDKYYSYDPSSREILLTGMNANAVRSSIQADELPPHNETSVSNKPARKFVVARKVSASTTSERATTDAATVCSQYHEEGDGGAKWRAPNLMELGLIQQSLSEKAANAATKEACRTQFSNTSFRYSWIIDTTGKILMNAYTESDKPTGTVVLRCVRDKE